MLESTSSQGFCRCEDPRMIVSLDYVTSQNFIGRPIQGYEDKVCILTREAATRLIQVQNYLDTQKLGLSLKIFDAYRPQQAVDDFRQWVETSPCEKMKQIYYPDLTKQDMVLQGYIGIERSTHTRGSTVDLTLCRINGDEWEELDMGTRFDYFSDQSHTHYANLSTHQKENRALLLEVMRSQGFENYRLEWWHFTLKDEPFPHTYFDFPVSLVSVQETVKPE